MRILVLGATGGIGIHTVEKALEASHQVVVYARSPEKLLEHIKDHPDVVIVKGELQDVAQLERALEGTQAVISSIGPAAFHPGGTPLAKAYAVLVELMHKHNVKRLIALGTPSIPDPNDKFDLILWTLVSGVATFARNAYKDIVAIGDTIRARDDLDWTIVRVPFLTNEKISSYYAGYIGDGHTRTSLPREAFAQFAMDELEKNIWIQKAPALSSA